MKNNKESGCGCLIQTVIVLVVCTICFGITYLIGTSDLPDWVKFLLLK